MIGDGAFLVALAVITLFNPVVAVLGIALGLIASHWSQCLLALLFGPFAFVIVGAIGWGVALPWPLPIMVAPAAFIWAVTAFGAKRSMTSGDKL